MRYERMQTLDAPRHTAGARTGDLGDMAEVLAMS
jgi:hypothetical protein